MKKNSAKKMRVIAGKYARREIKTPQWQGVRPLLSRLRKALFDTLFPFIRRGPFLDLYSGTGAFAIEALSRGAPSATIVELDPKTLQLIEKNLKAIRVSEPVELIGGDALKELPKLARKKRQYAIIAIAPPYHQGLEEATLNLLDQYSHLLQTDGIAFVQYPTDSPTKLQYKNLSLWKTKKYGMTSFSFFLPKDN